MNKKIALIVALAISCPAFGQADDRVANKQDEMRARMSDVKNEERFHKLINDSSDVYSAIAKGPHGEVPSSVLSNARCIAVLPSVFTGAIVVGGTHGEGLASCKASNGAWSQPAPVSINQASLGLQAGAKSSDLVLFFQSNEAAQALKRGNFSFGTDVSAVAGNFDSSVDTSAAGVVAYSRTEGAFAGASVNGGKLGTDQDDLAHYYGKKVDYRALLDGTVSPDSSGYTKNLTKLFP